MRTLRRYSLPDRPVLPLDPHADTDGVAAGLQVAELDRPLVAGHPSVIAAASVVFVFQSAALGVVAAACHQSERTPVVVQVIHAVAVGTHIGSHIVSSGEFGEVVIVAVIGAYIGGSLANDSYNPVKVP